MSLPISPAVALDEPESGVNSACMLFERRQPRARRRRQLLLLVQPLLQHPVALRGCAGLRHAVANRNPADRQSAHSPASRASPPCSPACWRWPRCWPPRSAPPGRRRAPAHQAQCGVNCPHALPSACTTASHVPAALGTVFQLVPLAARAAGSSHSDWRASPPALARNTAMSAAASRACRANSLRIFRRPLAPGAG